MTYTPVFQPYAHQRKALKRLSQQPSAFALFMAMRTGKTKVIIDDFGRLENAGDVDDLLVIAPAGVYHTWVSDIHKHMDPFLLSQTKIHVWSANGGKTQDAQLKEFMDDETCPRILLVNVEALSGVDRARKLCKTFLSNPNRCKMLVVDESTTIKNPGAKRAKFIVNELAPLADYRRILSGLPSPKSPLDLFMQFAFLNPGIIGHTSYFTFRARYAVIVRQIFGGRSIPLITGYQNVEELKRKIAPYSYRVTLDECYDLPPKIYQIREVELTERQQQIYNDLRKYATSQLSEQSHVTTTQVITQLLRLHQIVCGHVTDENGKLHLLPQKRIDVLLDLLREHEGKAIIWCSYDIDVQMVSEILLKEFGPDTLNASVNTTFPNTTVARFWGGNISTREEEEQTFLHNPECQFMVATAAAGGRGRTWTCADLVVYYSNTYDLEHRSQSEERAQGIDKVKSVLYVDLVAPKTVDEKILKALRNKINLSSMVIGDKWREWLI